jgi:hypothetical protein
MRPLQPILLLISFEACQHVSEPIQNIQVDTVDYTKIDDKTLNCENGIKKARQEVQKGILGLYQYGDRSICADVFDSLLAAKYELKIYSRGCVIAEGWKCYNDYMDSLIKIKFKGDIFRETYYESNKVGFYNHTGKDPDKLKLIDLTDRNQQNYLGCFLRYDTTISNQQWSEVRNNVKKIIKDEKVSKEGVPIKMEYDTNGLVRELYAHNKINLTTKAKIIDELNKYGSNIVFEMDGKKKNVMLPFFYLN